MRRFMQVCVCGAVLAALVGQGRAQDAAAALAKAHNRVLARRAARVDAIRKLAERIQGLKITSTTTVKDFVTESDVIQTSVMAFLSGIKEAKAVYTEDGACEVTLEVTLKTVKNTLKAIHRTHYKGNKIHVQDFEKMEQTNTIKVLRETGSGAPREEFIEAPLVPPPPGEGQARFGDAPVKIKDFWKQHVSPRGRLAAERAARVDAMRKLAERVRGVHITANTTVKDFVATSDNVRVRMDTFLKGAREVGVRYHDGDLIVEVEMQVKLRTVYATLKTWSDTHVKARSIESKALENLILHSEDRVIREIGMGVPPKNYLRVKPTKVEADVMRTAAKAPMWIAQRLQATGQALIDPDSSDPTEAKLTAFRAAEIDARRKLAEQIETLQITDQTTVRDFVGDHDELQVSMLTFLQGAEVMPGSSAMDAKGRARVTVEIELKGLWSSILHYQKELAINIK